MNFIDKNLFLKFDFEHVIYLNRVVKIAH